MALPLLSALLVWLGTLDEWRLLAPLALFPLLISVARRVRAADFFIFGTVAAALFQAHYRLALMDELGEVTGNAAYAGLIVAMALPYAALALVAGRVPVTRPSLRSAVVALGVGAVWLATDALLPTKYWIALALDSAPLWLVRTGGEALLVGALLGVAWLAASAFARRCVWCGALSLAAVGWLWFGDPLAGEGAAPLPGAFVGLQFCDSGQKRTVGEMRRVEDERLASALWAIPALGPEPGGIVVLPELSQRTPLDRQMGVFERFARQTHQMLLVNGRVAVGRNEEGGEDFRRVSRLLRPEGAVPGEVAKKRLIPYFETRHNAAGDRYVADSGGLRRLEAPFGGLLPLLCLDVFDRTVLDGLAQPPALVTVAADTSRYRHPAVDRYLARAAAFQSQRARAPVLLVNCSGPSLLARPGGRVDVLAGRGEHALLVVGRDGAVRRLPLAWAG